jgi:hypothetical protein
VVGKPSSFLLFLKIMQSSKVSMLEINSFVLHVKTMSVFAWHIMVRK